MGAIQSTLYGNRKLEEVRIIKEIVNVLKRTEEYLDENNYIII